MSKERRALSHERSITQAEEIYDPVAINYDAIEQDEQQDAEAAPVEDEISRMEEAVTAGIRHFS